MSDKTIYQFKAETPAGTEVNLNTYQGKVLLIVNTASECGFAPQLKDLEELRTEFDHSVFEILAFPSNDFGGQEPLNDNEITAFCTINHQANYTIFGKIDVRGADVHPLYKFLSDKELNGNIGVKPRWNFHKYLINTKGEVVDYFYPFTKPNTSRVKKKIRRLLEQKS